jgi:hypothetical protein
MFTLATRIPAFQHAAASWRRRRGNVMTRTSRNLTVGVIVILGLARIGRAVCADQAPSSTVLPVLDQDLETADSIPRPRTVSQVLDWNQIFVDTLVATNTANSSSQRLGAIVHTAIFDAFNGIQQRYTPIFVHDRAPDGASRRGAVIAAAYTALVGLFPSQQPALLRLVGHGRRQRHGCWPRGNYAGGRYVGPSIAFARRITMRCVHGSS